MPHAYAVIMAGGSGTRFWPLSRPARPKQLLALGPSEASLLRATVDRVSALIDAERTLVVTSSLLADAVAAELPDVPRENILAEPVGRNTALCVGWAASHVRRRDPDGVLVVLPSDHYIADAAAFHRALARGLYAASEGDLVAVGVRPTRPETGYGYIEVGEELADDVHDARRFVEKPNRQRAERFLASGHFLWNSGIFVFRASVILDAIATHLPGLGASLDAFDAAAARGGEREAVEQGYAELPAISIDHGVMEKAANVAVVPASFGWSDLGSWTTAWELAAQDGEGNVAPDGAVLVDARRSYVKAPPGKTVALVGVDDLVVVDTADALLVVHREHAQDVRRVVEALRSRDASQKPS